MSGHKKFDILRAGLDTRLAANPVARKRVEGQRQLTETMVKLGELRRTRGATQQQVADAWDATQANISQIENTADIYLSTLCKYVAALGGELQLAAVFPDEVISLIGDAHTGK